MQRPSFGAQAPSPSPGQCKGLSGWSSDRLRRARLNERETRATLPGPLKVLKHDLVVAGAVHLDPSVHPVGMSAAVAEKIVLDGPGFGRVAVWIESGHARFSLSCSGPLPVLRLVTRGRERSA